MNIDKVFRVGTSRTTNYIKAVTKNREVRKAELRQTLSNTKLEPNAIVLDLPSLGDNFRYAIADKPITVLSCDYTPQHLYKTKVIQHDIYDWGLPKADALVTVASLHHTPDLITFLKAAQVNLKPTGTIHIADVVPNSAISRFLDNVVHKPTEKGIYRDFNNIEGVVRNQVLACPWVFRKEIQALSFVKTLFNLNAMTLSTVFDLLNDYGLIRISDNYVSVTWELLYVDIQLESGLIFN